MLRTKPSRPSLNRVTVPSAVLALVLALVSCSGGKGGAGPGEALRSANLPDGVDTVVERVVDGDTIVLADDNHVRLIGVDTPETKHPNKGVECFGKEASAFLSSLLPQGTGLRLVGDVEQRDHYDRLLAYAYRLPDGLFVNAELVREGYADVLTVPPNVAHSRELLELSRAARAAGRGLWSACGGRDRADGRGG